MKIALLGECMVELSLQQNDLYKLGFGGDTLNTAIYLVRSGGQADYFTVLGDDRYSKFMLLQWQSEGVGTEQVKIKNEGMPGLYIIENDEAGERSFSYWRDHAAAKSLISDFPEIYQSLLQYPFVFLSGITLSLYSDDDLSELFLFLGDYRKQGGKVVFDNNYRARNWDNPAHATVTFSKMMTLTDIALISFDDELALYGDHSIEECGLRWSEHGVKQVTIKNGHKGCLVVENNVQRHVPLTSVLKPVDTTAAGDSFNGAYLAALLSGLRIDDCIHAGQVCAGNVIMHKGAIIERSVNLQQEFQG